MPGCWPGVTSGAEGALTPGVNKLPPVGLMLFSVGGAGAVLDAGDVVVVVVVEIVDGAWLPLLPHPARSAPIATRTVAPARAVRRGLMRFVLITNLLSVSLSVAMTVHPRWLSRCRWRYHLG